MVRTADDSSGPQDESDRCHASMLAGGRCTAEIGTDGNPEGVDLVAISGQPGGNRRTMNVMRVDNPEHNHDHGFGLGAEQTEPQDTGAGEHTSATHGLFEHVGGDSADVV